MARTTDRYRTAEEYTYKASHVVQDDFRRKGIPAYITLGLRTPVIVVENGVARAFYIMETRGKTKYAENDAKAVEAWCKSSGLTVVKVVLRMLIVTNPYVSGRADIEKVRDFSFERDCAVRTPDRSARNENSHIIYDKYDVDLDKRSNETVCDECWTVRTPTGACACF